MKILHESDLVYVQEHARSNGYKVRPYYRRTNPSWHRQKSRKSADRSISVSIGIVTGVKSAEMMHQTSWSALLFVLVGAVIALLTRSAVRKRIWAGWSLAWLSASSARSLTALAVQLAGRKRTGLCDEWRAHLAGESGYDPVTWRKLKEAVGFVVSATKCRCRDTVDASWRPVDAMLKSRTLSNLAVSIPTAMAAAFILRREGTLGLLMSAEGISAIGGSLYALVRVGRWWRDVRPPEPRARRAKEQ